MIEKRIIFEGDDAELLSRALAEVKSAIYNACEHRATDAEAIEALVLSFRKEDGHESYLDLLSRRGFARTEKDLGRIDPTDPYYPLFVY